MKVIFAVLSIAAVASAGLVAAPASFISRAPAFDSAVIKSDRLGGNFAYSVAEAHAYAQHTPIVQHVASPVAVSYSAPAVHAVAAPVAVAHAPVAVARAAIAAPVAVAHHGLPLTYAAGIPSVYGYGPAVARIA